MSAVAEGLALGGKAVAQGIVWTGDWLRSGVHKSGGQLKGSLKPNEKPVQVPAAVAGAVEAAASLSPHAVTLSKSLVKGLVAVAHEIGTTVAEGVVKVTAVNGQSAFNGPKSAAAKHLGLATAGAVADVWDALERASQGVIYQTRETAVGLVEHKYGQEVAKTTYHGLSVAVDTIETAYAVKSLGPRALSRRVVRRTGQSALQRTIELLAHEQTEAIAIEPSPAAPPPSLVSSRDMEAAVQPVARPYLWQSGAGPGQTRCVAVFPPVLSRQSLALPRRQSLLESQYSTRVGGTDQSNYYRPPQLVRTESGTYLPSQYYELQRTDPTDVGHVVAAPPPITGSRTARLLHRLRMTSSLQRRTVTAQQERLVQYGEQEGAVEWRRARSPTW
jgi:hypothetical protein